MVDPAAARRAFTLGRLPAPPDLADRVDWFWLVRWDLPAGESFTQTVIPHPCVNLVAEASGFAAHGIPDALFDRTLIGAGVVVAAKLRPGALSVPGDVRTGGGRPGRWRRESGEHALALAGRGDDEAAVAVLAASCENAWHPTRTLRRSPAFSMPPPRASSARTRASRTSPGSPGRAPAVSNGCSASGWASDQVGAAASPGPPRRRAPRGGPGQDLAALAIDIGYYDQAHLAVDFVSATGHTPGAYARRCAESRARLLELASS
ncbi:DUF6597 domain-containing transcriptional factor [Oerskovia sp. M15]